MGSFFQGPIVSFEVLEGREGPQRVSGGSDGSESLESLLECDILT